MLTIAQYMEMAKMDICDMVEYDGVKFERACKIVLRDYTAEQLPGWSRQEVASEAYRELYW